MVDTQGSGRWFFHSMALARKTKKTSMLARLFGNKNPVMEYTEESKTDGFFVSHKSCLNHIHLHEFLQCPCSNKIFSLDQMKECSDE